MPGILQSIIVYSTTIWFYLYIYILELLQWHHIKNHLM